MKTEVTRVSVVYATRVPDPALWDLAEAQRGVLSRHQILALGGTDAMIRRLLREGRWHRVVSGIVSTSRRPEWLGWVWAGLLLGGSSAVVGGAAAAHLHGITGQPDVVDIWAPGKSPRWRHPWRFHRQFRSGRGEPAKVSLEQATMDVCSIGDADEIAATLASAVSTRRTTPERLRLSAQAQPCLRHRRLILELLEDVGAGAESPLEVRYLRDVERAHGLPPGDRQVSVSSGTRSDVGYLELGVLVELDGVLGHSGTGAWRDWERDNAHALGQFTTLRYGWQDIVSRPCAVARQVAEALGQGGWMGIPTRCRSCRHLPSP